MAATTMAALMKTAESPKFLRKAIQLIAFAADMDVSVPDAITDTDGKILALNPGWWPIGLVDKKGWEITNKTDKDEVESLNYASPTRTDITKVERQLQVTAQESFRKQVMQFLYGIDMSGVSPAANGEYKFDHPATPVSREQRILLLGCDPKEGPGKEWYFGYCFPRTSLAEIPGETLGNALIDRQATFDCLVDDDLGTARRDYVGGPAAKAHAAELGFPPAA